MPTSQRTERRTTIAVVAAVFVSQTPITLVAVSLADIADDTGIPVAGLQWIQSLYLLAMAAAVLSAGVIADITGRKRIIVAALLLMACGGAVGVVASISDTATLPILLAGQALAGIGAGALLPTTLATINTTILTPARRAKAVAAWGGGTTGGLAFGVLAGGGITHALTWGWVYVVLCGFAAAAAAFAASVLSRAATTNSGMDVLGQIAATLGIAALIYGIIRGGAAGFLSPEVLVAYAVAAVALVGFLINEKRTPQPLVPLAMFRSPLFNAAALGAAMALFTVIGTGFLLVLFLGQALDYSPWQIALHMVFMPGAALIAAFTVASPLMARFPAPGVLLLGTLSAGLGTGALSQIGQDFSHGDIAWRLAFIGLGIALMISPAAAMAVHSCVPELAPKAGAVNTVFRQVGGALAPALLGSLYATSGTGGSAELPAFTATISVITWLLAGTATLTVWAILANRNL